MKKISLLFVTVFLNFFLYSCSGEDLVFTGESSDSGVNVTANPLNNDTQACCGDEGDILPPPPPPPPPPGGN